MFKAALQLAVVAGRAALKAAPAAIRATPKPLVNTNKLVAMALLKGSNKFVKPCLKPINNLTANRLFQDFTRRFVNKVEHKVIEIAVNKLQTSVVIKPTLKYRARLWFQKVIDKAKKLVNTAWAKTVALLTTIATWVTMIVAEGPSQVKRSILGRIWDAVVRFIYRCMARFRRTKVRVKGFKLWRILSAWRLAVLVRCNIIYRSFKNALRYRYERAKVALGGRSMEASLWWAVLGIDIMWSAV